MTNVLNLGKRSVIDQLEELLELARAGAIVGLCGYTVTSDHHIHSINTDHGMINNGMISYCSIMLARQVTEDDAEDGDYDDGYDG